jgi:spore coat protein CotH
MELEKSLKNKKRHFTNSFWDMNQYRFYLLLLCSLILASCKSENTLPVLKIETNTELNFEDKQKGELTFFKKNKPIQIEAKFKYRGGFSSQFEKRSYTISIDSAFSIYELPQGKDWILNANYIDKTFMRHKVCFDLFSEMHFENRSAKSTYVQLLVNDKPQGLYVLMQQINEETLQLNTSDSSAMLFKDPPIFYRQRLDSANILANYYEQKFPDFGLQNKNHELDKLRSFLFKSPDENFADSISFWFDIRNVVDWHILLLLTNNGDGIMKNFYLYKINSATPFRIAIWDYDHSFCRDGDNEYNNLESELNWRASILLKRLVEIESTQYLAQLKERWEGITQK